ncbi:MAG: hypothetical protein PHO70_03210 [Candidatus Omnitrophica bacterium]|nr:hypothetical protein [Candidatus Omnitrophota bacterium]
MNETQLLPAVEHSREILKKFAESITGWQVKDTDIKMISVRSFSNRVKRFVISNVCVGEELNENLSDIIHEPVLAIFESNEFLVITPDKIKANKRIYFFNENEVFEIENNI